MAVVAHAEAARGAPRHVSAGTRFRTLANGLKVVVVTQHEQPAVSLRMIVRAGAANDPQGRAGLANMVASLLDQGTATRSAGDVAEAIDYIGGVLGAGGRTCRSSTPS